MQGSGDKLGSSSANTSTSNAKNRGAGRRIRRRDETTPIAAPTPTSAATASAPLEATTNDNSITGNTSDSPTTTTTTTQTPEQHHNNNNNDNDSSMAEKIRHDWIDAVFGPSFFAPNAPPDYKPPRQGMGLAQIPSFVTYQASIPPPPVAFAEPHLALEQAREPKLGMTLSKLALGLYVREVQPESEAALAGVQPGSILVDINGMGMLVEPSRHALERLWQYEGLFAESSPSPAGTDTTTTTGTVEEETSEHSAGTMDPLQSQALPQQQQQQQQQQQSNDDNHHRPRMQDPLAMTFMKDGKPYTVLLVANPPYGILWASCGDFCLVNRAYSYASSVGGIRRGSIVASVNGKTLRDMDHLQFGDLLRQLFQSRTETIHVWMCYTPAAARTGHFERMMEEASSGAPNTSGTTTHTSTTPKKKPSFTQKSNGVEVRYHSLEESWLSFWGSHNSGGSNSNSNHSSPCGPSPLAQAWSTVTRRRNGTHNRKQGSSSLDDLQGSVAELASRVVAGEKLTTLPKTNVHWSRRQRIYAPCPVLPNPVLLRIWDPLESLIYCLSFHQHLQSGFSSGALIPICGGPTTDPIVQIKSLASDAMVQKFLWQFISLIATATTTPADKPQPPPEPRTGIATAPASDGHYIEEKKEDSFLPLMNTTAATTLSRAANPVKFDSGTHGTTSSSNSDYAEILSSVLLKLSRKDQDFCQRLYFCLRSTLKYVGPDLERSSSSLKETSESKTSLQHNHLLALFNCLKLLRSAEREAANGGNFGTMMSVEQQWLNTSTTTSTSATTTTVTAQKEGCSELELEAALDTSQAISGHAEKATQNEKSEKRRLFGLFRKKKKNKKKSNSSSIEKAPERPSSPVRNQPITASPRRVVTSYNSQIEREIPAIQPLLENMSEFVKELDTVCSSIEKKLLKSFSQKITEWALQPWSASKCSVLHTLTDGMRQSLAVHSGKVDTSLKKRGQAPAPFCLVNPLDPQELLIGIDPEECYILPSAHFPLLLSFDAIERPCPPVAAVPKVLHPPSMLQRGKDQTYRIRVDVCNLNSSAARLVLHGAIGGSIQESFSMANANGTHVFRQRLQFDTRCSWGAPRTLSLRLTNVPEEDEMYGIDAGTASNELPLDGGFGWIDLVPLWDRLQRFKEPESYCTAIIYSMADYSFDEQGNLLSRTATDGKIKPIHLELKVTTEIVSVDHVSADVHHPNKSTHKRMLLYKHDDDLRQEAFAIRLIKTCDAILKANGLDLKLLTFGCIPVGVNRGFIEWVDGSVPLSDICQKPFASFFGTTKSAKTANNSSSEEDGDEDNGDDDEDDMSMVAKAGMSNYEPLYRMGMAEVGTAAATAMKSTRNMRSQQGVRGSLANNPVQDFLRSIAFDPQAPYFVRRDVMDTYIKSCAGYCVITYILGVGDRHLDNLLLHNHTGCFFHCDYSFLFGNDPKKYLPMRVTEDMIYGMGGRDSDNYAKFLSLTGSAFLTLRRPENVRFLLSLIRVMEAARLPHMNGDGSGAAEVLIGLRQRLRLDLTEEQAVAFMEEMIETSLSSKMWLAVDAIHSLGKRF